MKDRAANPEYAAQRVPAMQFKYEVHQTVDALKHCLPVARITFAATTVIASSFEGTAKIRTCLENS